MLKGKRGGQITPAEKARQIWNEELDVKKESAEFVVNRTCPDGTLQEKAAVLRCYQMLIEKAAL